MCCDPIHNSAPHRRARTGAKPRANSRSVIPPRKARVSRRAAQPTSGERRHCSRQWMAELAPAGRWRAAQGTGRNAAGAMLGCPFSWLLLFGQAKRSDSETAKRASKRCFQLASRRWGGLRISLPRRAPCRDLRCPRPALEYRRGDPVRIQAGIGQHLLAAGVLEKRVGQA
jgi:hypothetical protein